MKSHGATVDDTDQPSGVAQTIFGYIREHFMMNEMELSNARQDLVDYAKANGWNLAAIFVERIETTPSAFEALAYELSKLEAPAFVVPGLHHLAGLGHPLIVQQQLEQLGTLVLVARPTPARHRDTTGAEWLDD